jgi:hypothetical protein
MPGSVSAPALREIAAMMIGGRRRHSGPYSGELDEIYPFLCVACDQRAHRGACMDDRH